MIDLTFLKKISKDNPQKMKRYISLYLDVAPNTFEEMHRNLQNEDWEQLRINAHSLKPQADFMGIASLKDALIKIEEAVKTNQLNNIEDLVETSHNISTKSEALLKDIFDQL